MKFLRPTLYTFGYIAVLYLILMAPEIKARLAEPAPGLEPVSMCSVPTQWCFAWDELECLRPRVNPCRQ